MLDKKRLFAALMTLVMLVSLLPVSVFASDCTHHQTHTADCGYAEAKAGTPCTHVHSEACCTTTVTCSHVGNHDAVCGYAEATEETEAVPCTHQCSDACAVEETTCTHKHDEACGYAPAVEAGECKFKCPECSADKDDNNEDPAPGCTGDMDCTLTEGHEEGCEKAAYDAALADCDKSDECAGTVHHADCAKAKADKEAAAELAKCDQTDACTAALHKEDCLKDKADKEAAAELAKCDQTDACTAALHKEDCLKAKADKEAAELAKCTEAEDCESTLHKEDCPKAAPVKSEAVLAVEAMIQRLHVLFAAASESTEAQLAFYDAAAEALEAYNALTAEEQALVADGEAVTVYAGYIPAVEEDSGTDTHNCGLHNAEGWKAANTFENGSNSYLTATSDEYSVLIVAANGVLCLNGFSWPGITGVPSGTFEVCNCGAAASVDLINAPAANVTLNGGTGGITVTGTKFTLEPGGSLNLKGKVNIKWTLTPGMQPNLSGIGSGSVINLTSSKSVLKANIDAATGVWEAMTLPSNVSGDSVVTFNTNAITDLGYKVEVDYAGGKVRIMDPAIYKEPEVHNCTIHTGVAQSQWQKPINYEFFYAIGDPFGGGYFYLDKDYGTLAGWLGADTVLCLNGHTVSSLNGASEYGVLTVCDCTGQGTVAALGLHGHQMIIDGIKVNKLDSSDESFKSKAILKSVVDVGIQLDKYTAAGSIDMSQAKSGSVIRLLATEKVLTTNVPDANTVWKAMPLPENLTAGSGITFVGDAIEAMGEGYVVTVDYDSHYVTIQQKPKIVKVEAGETVEVGGTEYKVTEGSVTLNPDGTVDVPVDAGVTFNGQTVLGPAIIDDEGIHYDWPVYNIISGGNQEVEKEDPATFVSNADFGAFVRVKVDGKVVDPAYYTAVSGSTKVTLKADYINTLAIGEHTLTVVSADGSASTVFTVEPQTVLVSFNSNGGTTPSTTQKEVTVGEAYGKLPTATKSGLYFAGWYTAKTGGTRVYDTTVVTADSDHTLYAHWSEVPVTGDNSAPMLWLGLLAMSLLGLAVIARPKRKKGLHEI